MSIPVLDYERADQQSGDFTVYKVLIVFILRCKKLFHFEARDFIGSRDRCLLLLLVCYVTACNKTWHDRTAYCQAIVRSR